MIISNNRRLTNVHIILTVEYLYVLTCTDDRKRQDNLRLSAAAAAEKRRRQQKVHTQNNGIKAKPLHLD